MFHVTRIHWKWQNLIDRRGQQITGGTRGALPPLLLLPVEDFGLLPIRNSSSSCSSNLRQDASAQGDGCQFSQRKLSLLSQTQRVCQISFSWVWNERKNEKIEQKLRKCCCCRRNWRHVYLQKECGFFKIQQSTWCHSDAQGILSNILRSSISTSAPSLGSFWPTSAVASSEPANSHSQRQRPNRLKESGSATSCCGFVLRRSLSKSLAVSFLPTAWLRSSQTSESYGSSGPAEQITLVTARGRRTERCNFLNEQHFPHFASVFTWKYVTRLQVNLPLYWCLGIASGAWKWYLFQI